MWRAGGEGGCQAAPPPPQWSAAVATTPATLQLRCTLSRLYCPATPVHHTQPHPTPHPSIFLRLLLYGKQVNGGPLQGGGGTPVQHASPRGRRPDGRQQPSQRSPQAPTHARRTSIMRCRRSSSSFFHCRRSHCHLPRNAARLPGASRNRPDHRLRPLPACRQAEGEMWDRGSTSSCYSSGRELCWLGILGCIPTSAHLIWRCHAVQASAAPRLLPQTSASSLRPAAAGLGKPALPLRSDRLQGGLLRWPTSAGTAAAAGRRGA